MATVHDMAVPRKRITTYGKAARRRVIPEYNFTSLATKSQSPEISINRGASPEIRVQSPVTPAKLKPVTRRSVSRTPSSASPPGVDVFDVPESDNDAPPIPPPKRKKATTPPARPKTIPSTKISKHPSPIPADIYDVPASDDEGHIPKRQKAAPPTKLKPAPSLATSKRPPGAPVDVFDVPDDDEVPVPKKKKFSPPAKLKPASSNTVSKRPSPAPTDALDVPFSNSEAPIPKRKRASPAPELKPSSSMTLSKNPSPAPIDVFDVPSNDDEAPKPARKALKSPQVRRLITKSSRTKSVPVPTPSPPGPSHDIFDVPSDGEEIPAPKLVPKISKLSVSRNTHKLPEKGVAAQKEDLGSRKRVKLSPVRITKQPLNDLLPRSRGGSKPPPGRTASPKYGHITNVVSRPKIQKPPPKAEPAKTPRKPSSVIDLGTPSPPQADVEMTGVRASTNHISPRGLKMWETLLDSGEEEEASSSNGGGRMRMIKSSDRIEHSSVAVPQGGLVLPRRRLIDCLVEQASEESDESSEEEDSEMTDSQPSQPSQVVDNDLSTRSHSLAPENLPPALLTDSQMPQASQGSGPKITYSRQRSMLAEADLMQQLAMDMPTQPPQGSNRRTRMASVPALKPLASFNEDEEDESSVVVKSVHELRKAGANNRFIDEIQDFLEQIGSPNKTGVSMRRSGLLDLASKMTDKSFVEKFRANGMEQKLFVHLGQETDIIAGFVMVALLIMILMDSNMPHIISHLRRQGITRLLIRLLECQTSITSLAKERKSNMSRVGQSLLIEHGEYVVGMPIWEELQPKVLSPRTIALRCLELMVRQTREAGNSSDIFSKELTTNLFAIMKSASEENSWDLPSGKQAVDFCLALSALESHSITARTVHDEAIWISEYLPSIRETLEVALSKPVQDFGGLHILILRLTLNVTNNNPRASDVFATPALMAAMGGAIVGKFSQISRFMLEDDLFVAVEHLILTLGVMINFAEWSSAARDCLQSLQGDISDPLDAMVQTFADNQERTSQADSVQESQKNVAFGYLSVLLGYLSLQTSVCERIQSKQPRKNLRPLVASIEEFIGHHKTVDLIAADEEGYNPQSGLTERLESLVNKLAALKVEKK